MPTSLQSRIASWLLTLPLLTTIVVGAGVGIGAGCTRIIAPSTGTGPTTSFTDPLAAHGIRYWLITRQEPRPLRIHHLQIDLDNPQVELSSILATDPDGTGPATAQLTSPLVLARQADALALINANPWQGIPDAEGKRSTNWHENMPVQILGLAAAQGTMRDPPADPAYCSVWLDARGRPHIGAPANLADVGNGVAGFLRLLQDGRVLHVPGGPIHPRTALGLDSTGRFLYLVVVDGRQPGYSEGMSYFELAMYMQELGCTQAVNLDGGGSSVMIVATGNGHWRVANDPSTKAAGVSVLRPIPAALVVRSRKPRTVAGDAPPEGP